MELGTDHESFGYGGTGKKSHGRKFEDYGERFGMGDVIGCWVDVARREVGFAKNGVDLGVAFAVGKKVKMLCPAVTLKNAQVRVAFDAEKAQKHEWVGRGENGMPTLEGNVEDVEGKNLAVTKLGETPVSDVTKGSIRAFCEQLMSSVNKYYAFGSCFVDDAQ